MDLWKGELTVSFKILPRRVPRRTKKNGRIARVSNPIQATKFKAYPTFIRTGRSDDLGYGSRYMSCHLVRF
jgi:hypothetical protein